MNTCPDTPAHTHTHLCSVSPEQFWFWSVCFSPLSYGSTLPDVFVLGACLVPPELGPVLLFLFILPPHPLPHLHDSPHLRPSPVRQPSSPPPLPPLQRFILSCPYGLCSQTEERLRPRRAATDLPAPHLHHHQWQQPPG